MLKGGGKLICINKGLTKAIIGAILLLISFNFIFVFVFGDNLFSCSKEYYQHHIARRPHITGKIKCIINGKTFLLNDKQAMLVYIDSSNNAYNLKLNNGEFIRRDGDYGDNIFELKLSPSFCTKNINKLLTNGVTLEFGYITSNNWHKEKIDLNIDIDDENTNDSMANVKLEQIITGDDKGNKIENYMLRYKAEEQEKLRVFTSFI